MREKSPIYHWATMLVLAALFPGCSFNTFVIKKMGPVFRESMEEMQTEGDYGLFKQSTPVLIKMLEGLLYQAPRDESLLSAAIKGHVAIGYGIHETQLLSDQLREKVGSPSRKKATYHYSKAMQYSKRYFDLKGIDIITLIKGDAEKILLDKVGTSPNDLDTLIFIGQAWGGLINLNKSDPILLAQIPVVESLIDFVCKRKPDIYHGSCLVLAGIIEVSRPAMFGGNPKKGKRLFLQSMKLYPQNLFNTLAYIQYYVIPRLDEREYKKYKRQLFKNFGQFEKTMKANPLNISAESSQSKVRLTNAIALERFRIIQRNEKNIF